jgi:hypothetical protein
MHMHKVERFPCAVLCVGLTACGLFFGPGYSMSDGDYFAEPPHVALEGDAYSLRWRYGRMGFFFIPSHKVVNGELLFSLQGTSSSGNLRGRAASIPITALDEIAAIKGGKVFWFEEGHRKIPLEIRQLRSADEPNK